MVLSCKILAHLLLLLACVSLTMNLYFTPNDSIGMRIYLNKSKSKSFLSDAPHFFLKIDPPAGGIVL